MRHLLAPLVSALCLACAPTPARYVVVPAAPALLGERFRYDLHPERMAMDSATYDVIHRGIDTATVERVFCLTGHTLAWPGDTVTVIVDSAWVPAQSGNAPGAVGGFHCPGPWAHWHLTHRGFLWVPSEVDILNNLDARTAFSLVVTETELIPFMVDERQIQHLPRAR